MHRQNRGNNPHRKIINQIYSFDSFDFSNIRGTRIPFTRSWFYLYNNISSGFNVKKLNISKVLKIQISNFVCTRSPGDKILYLQQ